MNNFVQKIFKIIIIKVITLYMSIAPNRFCTKAKYPLHGVQSAFYDGFCRIAVRVGCGNKRLCEQGAKNIIMRMNNYPRKILEGKTPLTRKKN